MSVCGLLCRRSFNSESFDYDMAWHNLMFAVHAHVNRAFSHSDCHWGKVCVIISVRKRGRILASACSLKSIVTVM